MLQFPDAAVHRLDGMVRGDELDAKTMPDHCADDGAPEYDRNGWLGSLVQIHKREPVRRRVTRERPGDAGLATTARARVQCNSDVEHAFDPIGMRDVMHQFESCQHALTCEDRIIQSQNTI
jgi:hypothetical protein